MAAARRLLPLLLPRSRSSDPAGEQDLRVLQKVVIEIRVGAAQRLRLVWLRYHPFQDRFHHPVRKICRCYHEPLLVPSWARLVLVHPLPSQDRGRPHPVTCCRR